MPQSGLGKKTVVLVLFYLLLSAALCGETPAAEETGKELFDRVCSMCHGWAVQNFLMLDRDFYELPPICPPPADNWLPIILTVATYQVYANGSEKSFPLIARRDVLKVARYLDENYPKEPICAGTEQ